MKVALHHRFIFDQHYLDYIFLPTVQLKNHLPFNKRPC